MKVNIFKFLLFLMPLYGCKENKSVIHSANNTCDDITTIALDDVNESSKIRLSSYLKEPKTIILETNEDCLIRRIHGIDIYKDNIYIHDDKQKRMYVFDMTGAFKNRIGKVGMGPGEYVELTDFSIDRDNGMIYLWDEARKRILKYNVETLDFVSSVDVPEVKGHSYNFLYFDNRFYLNSTVRNQSEEKYLLNEIDIKTGSIIKKHLPADVYNKGWNLPLRLPHSGFYSKNSKVPKYTELFSDTIFSFTKNGIESDYAISSSRFAPRKVINEMIDYYYRKKGRYNLMSLYKNNYIYQVSHLVDVNRFLYMQYVKGPDLKHLFYDKENKSLEITSVVCNDYISSQYDIYTDLFFSDEDGALTILNTECLADFVEAVLTEKINKELDKYELLTKIDEDSNPILFYHGFK